MPEPQGGAAPESSEKEEAVSPPGPPQASAASPFPELKLMGSPGPSLGPHLRAFPLQPHPPPRWPPPRVSHSSMLTPPLAYPLASSLASTSAPRSLGVSTPRSDPCPSPQLQPLRAAFCPPHLPLSPGTGTCCFLCPETPPITLLTATLPSELSSKSLPPGPQPPPHLCSPRPGCDQATHPPLPR